MSAPREMEPDGLVLASDLRVGDTVVSQKVAAIRTLFANDSGPDVTEVVFEDDSEEYFEDGLMVRVLTPYQEASGAMYQALRSIADLREMYGDAADVAREAARLARAALAQARGEEVGRG